MMSVTQKEKAVRFQALHEGPGAFVIPNPWDVASARVLAGFGFQALATSSAAAACVVGRRDHGLAPAVERIAAAAEAARALQFAFVLTARAHNLLYANPNLDETISRLQAFENAGADVLFAPGLPDLAAVSAVCAALSRPVNFMVGIKGRSFSVAELAAAGVRRISLATSLYRAAMTGFLDAVREVKDTGTFDFLNRCVTTPELNKRMQI